MSAGAKDENSLILKGQKKGEEGFGFFNSSMQSAVILLEEIF